MLPQERLIERVRALCQADDRLDAAMMYGSFTRGEGDAFSDVEFLLFFTDEALPGLDRRGWLEQVAPVDLLLVNDFGTTNAIFDTLVRGEFHFHSVSEMTLVEDWRGSLSFPSLEAVLIADKSGRLAPRLEPLFAPVDRAQPEALQSLADNFLNWWLFGLNVLQRGEHARALELLGILQRYLLWLARLDENQTDKWFIPARAAEKELSAQSYARFRACTAALDPAALHRAYSEVLAWGGALLDNLAARYGFDARRALRERLAGRIESGRA